MNDEPCDLPPEQVRFFERAGPGARAVLARLGRELRATGANVELLVGTDQPDRWLLAVRGGGTEPPLDGATRRWRFRAVDW